MKKEHKWFKEPIKKGKEKDFDSMKFAKDALLITGGVIVLGAGASVLGGLLD